MKKTILSTFLILFGLTISFSQNLLVNGGFEDDPADFAPWGSAFGATVQSVEINSGANALELRNTGQAYFGQVLPQNGGADPSVDFLPSTTYLVTAFVKGDGGIDGVPGNAFLSVQFQESGTTIYEYLNYVNVKTDSGNFDEFSFKVNATADQLQSIRVAYFHGNSSGLYWIDDISIVPDGGGSDANDILATTNGTLSGNVITLDVTTPVTKDVLLAGLTVSDNATAQIFSSTRKQVGSDAEINSGHTIRVFAEDGTYQLYTIEGTNDQLIKSVGGGAVLDNTAYSITNISNPSTVTDLLGVIDLYDGATAEVLDGETVVEATEEITNSMIVRVTGTSEYQDYTLELSTVILENIALNKTVTYKRYSNEQTDGYGDPALVTDGVTLGENSERVVFWIGSDPVGGEVVIDLAEEFNISKYKTYSGAGGSWGNPLRNFTFEVWDASLNDGAGDWSVVETVTGNGNGVYSGAFSEVITDRVRLVVTSGAGNYLRLFELEVFGTSATANIDEANFAGFSMYPNPVQGDYLNLISPNTNVESIKVFNVLGKQVKAELRENKVDVSGLNSGLYMIRINDSKTLKFIKK